MSQTILVAFFLPVAAVILATVAGALLDPLAFRAGRRVSRLTAWSHKGLPTGLPTGVSTGLPTGLPMGLQCPNRLLPPVARSSAVWGGPRAG